MAKKMCMAMMIVMVLVSVECATINKGIEDYNSCVTDCVARCGGDEHCSYRCRWRCAKAHTSQLIVKDEAVSPQEDRRRVCAEYCRIKCGEDEFCKQKCMENCPF